ncbi:hypothetical protein [Labilibaculum euxinus]
MKFKTRTIKHPSGVEIETPLFIPSYSSKGFALERKKNGKYKSEVCKVIQIAKEMLFESQLVSAYDLYYDFLLKPSELISTELTFIDSGGYETSSSYDFSETKRSNTNHEEWNINYLESVLNKWPQDRFPAVIVSFDDERYRKSLAEQINDATKYFSKYPKFMHDFLIKPETLNSDFIKIDNVIRSIKLLKDFDVIGVTEKELGNSILERMQRIYKIRKNLDENSINAPIHVFGSLDPITVILYFLAGAEIFDGLTWLKYSYFNGVAMYTNNLCALDKNIEINTIDSQVKATSIVNNIHYLSRLKNILINFAQSENNFKLFDDLGFDGLGDIIEKNYLIFKNRLKK